MNMMIPGKLYRPYYCLAILHRSKKRQWQGIYELKVFMFLSDHSETTENFCQVLYEGDVYYIDRYFNNHSHKYVVKVGQ